MNTLTLAFAIPIIFATSLMLIQVYGQRTSPPGVPGNYSLQDYERIIQYCFDHADQILSGKNPVQDLVKSGLIPLNFENKSCNQVQNQTEQLEDFMNPP
jgi:hypothetical protein